ncbi:MAG: bifunctional (p)ppGpp synthetase/guanosine-3',5'-bis(diphosphate) 3'-pyrophosphohydrolase [Bacteroidales bacterium]|nr:bifunctional (p)ppGpp synthetase/guanosine-3',5'-bis(diphosphate) 3'-pyrophosphohydrolase [Bacteroidales bacterium]
MKKKLEPYIQYVKKTSSHDEYMHYSKAVKELKPTVLNRNFFIGLINEDFLLGMKKILKEDLKTQGVVFTAAILSFVYLKTDDLEHIENNYTKEIERILDGIIKVRSLDYSKSLEHPDLQRKLVLSVARDTRSLLILLAANLYILRHYEDLGDFQQKTDILNSTISVFIPIAHRLGFYKIKSELENLVLSIQEPEIFLSIQAKLAESEKERNKIINDFISPLILEMNKHGLQYKIKSRLKSINSIFTKIKKQNVSFDKVYDLWAIRIILDSKAKKEKEDCWHAYSIVTNTYESNLDRLRDWITVPKSSGYESLHATVKSHTGKWVEVQIRTDRMDEEAENGMAAHWRYKGGKSSQGIDFWLSEIRKAIDSDTVGGDQIQPDKFANEVFVFTPNGDLKKLQYSATVLDFAYAIHSEVGNKCANAKVNGRIVPIKYALRNGDQVEIQTNKNQKPSIDWLSWVASTRTKTKIRKALDEQKTIEINRGKEILERKFKNWKIDFSQNVIDSIVDKLELKEHYDLFYNVSVEKIDPLDIKRLALGEDDVKTDLNTEIISLETKEISDSDIENSQKDILIIDKIDHINYKLAKCCNPIQGDKIFGFVTVSSGITIHRNSCPNAAEMKKRYAYRIIPSQWRKSKRRVSFKTGITILATDSMGLANKITQVISTELKLDITSMNFKQKKGLFEGNIDLLVNDSEHLDLLLAKIRKINGVTDVFRKDF